LLHSLTILVDAQKGEFEPLDEKHLITFALGYSYIPKGKEDFSSR